MYTNEGQGLRFLDKLTGIVVFFISLINADRHLINEHILSEPITMDRSRGLCENRSRPHVFGIKTGDTAKYMGRSVRSHFCKYEKRSGQTQLFCAPGTKTKANSQYKARLTSVMASNACAAPSLACYQATPARPHTTQLPHQTQCSLPWPARCNASRKTFRQS